MLLSVLCILFAIAHVHIATKFLLPNNIDGYKDLGVGARDHGVG